LRSYAVGGLPIINHMLERMQLLKLLKEHLPPDDPRTQLDTPRAVLVLVRNILMSREPVYAVGEWAQRHPAGLLDLWWDELELLNDDRLGRALSGLFRGLTPSLIMAIVRHVVREFQLRLDELHNDSTSVSVYGAYAHAEQAGMRDGRPTHAITWGHSKDHRPDLKQLLYILTVSNDGGVPVYFESASGNTVDDQTHCETWRLMCELVGRPDFLYVADCKLATTGNMNYIAQRDGRFVSVLPATRKEDTTFRRQLRAGRPAVQWQHLYDLKTSDEPQQILDSLFVCQDEQVSAEGYRLLWYRSTRKQELDQATRARRTQRALAELTQLRERLQGTRTRFRERPQVEQAVQKILQEHDVADWVTVDIQECEQIRFRQTRPGRPGKNTSHVKQVSKRYTLSWSSDPIRLAEEQADDGVFPLISNARDLTAEELLRAYKRQPVIEKRFSQLKTDFAVAPVYLKDVGRIQGLLGAYFLVLLVQTLIERELRQAMQRHQLSSLPIYPENRPCTRPTTQRVLELFESIQYHELTRPGEHEPETLITELSATQRQVLKLLGISPNTYGG
jgi:transposase